MPNFEQRNKDRESIQALIRQHGPLTSSELAKAIGINARRIGYLMINPIAEGKVVRVKDWGVLHQSLYAIPGQPIDEKTRMNSGHPPTDQPIKCKICNIIKPAVEFHANPGMKNGRVNKCKTCSTIKKSACNKIRREELIVRCIVRLKQVGPQSTKQLAEHFGDATMHRIGIALTSAASAGRCFKIDRFNKNGRYLEWSITEQSPHHIVSNKKNNAQPSPPARSGKKNSMQEQKNREAIDKEQEEWFEQLQRDIEAKKQRRMMMMMA